jgi:hypothetical protein
VFTNDLHFFSHVPQAQEQLKGLWVNFGSATSITKCEVTTSPIGATREEGSELFGFKKLLVTCGNMGTRLSFALPKVERAGASSVFVRVCFWQGLEDATAFVPSDASWWFQTGPAA